MCQQWPFGPDQLSTTGMFVLRYSLEQLFPSVVWMSQDATLVATACGLDPATILNDMSGKDVHSANRVLLTTLLSTSRYFFAGFMMIAQLFRAANLSMRTFALYEERIQLGREPPLVTDQLVVRFCGRDSHVSELSLKRMSMHIFPVFEDPQRVQFLVWKHSEQKRRPVYWCVAPGLYGSAYSWVHFPADANCFLSGIHNPDDKILVLEADATNGNDPLTLGEKAMDLTLEDASQGFRRILELYAAQGLMRGKHFRTLRVYLGNSMETAMTGGGHLYTLRHRIHYAKEIDVLIDSRASVLHKILEWCEHVTGPTPEQRKLFFQTSSRDYFLNLQKLLQQYGYEIYDPLDLRMLNKMRDEIARNECPATQAAQELALVNALLDDRKQVQEDEWDDHKEFLDQFSKLPDNNHNEAEDISPNDNNDDGTASSNAINTKIASRHRDDGGGKSEMLRKVVRMSKLPRLIHMKTTAETVNAVDALIMAGEVDASNCCALIDREEGVTTLERTLKQMEDFVQNKEKVWTRRKHATGTSSGQKKSEETDGYQSDKDDNTRKRTSGLQIICSSTIHDDVLRQVRLWARYGYSATEIQREMDAQYQDILHKSFAVQRQVRSDKPKEEASKHHPGILEEEESPAPESTPEVVPEELAASPSASNSKEEESSTK